MSKPLRSFEDLVGEVLVDIKKHTRYQYQDELIFTLENGKKYVLAHDQQCCEDVYIEDIIGDLHDLIGLPILMAEEVTSEEHPEDITTKQDDYFTWSFYKLATKKGYVTIRWYGASNGNYSEIVNWEAVDWYTSY